MSSDGEASIHPTIPKINTTTMHIANEPTNYIEYFFNIHYLEHIGLDMHETFLSCGIRRYFKKPQTIYLELIRIF